MKKKKKIVPKVGFELTTLCLKGRALTLDHCMHSFVVYYQSQFKLPVNLRIVTLNEVKASIAQWDSESETISHHLSGSISSGSLVPRPFEGRRKGLVHTECAWAKFTENFLA